MNTSISKTTSPAGPDNLSAQASPRSNAQQAADHARAAAASTGRAVTNAAHAAQDELRSGASDVRSELDEASSAAQAALKDVTHDIQQKWETSMTQGRELVAKSESLVRQHPLAALGIAAASGYILGRLLGR